MWTRLRCTIETCSKNTGTTLSVGFIQNGWVFKWEERANSAWPELRRQESGARKSC